MAEKTMAELTKEYDRLIAARSRAQEELENVCGELDGVKRQLAVMLDLNEQPFQLNGGAKPAKRQRAGTPRLTKERVHAMLSTSDKGMTIEELTAQVENDPAGFKREGLSDRLASILSEVATKKGGKYQAKAGFTSKRGRGK